MGRRCYYKEEKEGRIRFLIDKFSCPFSPFTSFSPLCSFLHPPLYEYSWWDALCRTFQTKRKEEDKSARGSSESTRSPSSRSRADLFPDPTSFFFHDRFAVFLYSPRTRQRKPFACLINEGSINDAPRVSIDMNDEWGKWEKGKWDCSDSLKILRNKRRVQLPYIILL